jgi:hypothetical protein
VPPPAGSGGALSLPNIPDRYRPQPRPPSLADALNKKYGFGAKPKDAMAEGIDGATNPDCLKEAPKDAPGGLLALPALANQVLQDKCRR